MARINRRTTSAGADAPDPAHPALAITDSNYVAAAARGLAVLEVIGGSGTLSNAEVAELTGLPKATVARLTGTLLQLGYLVQGQGRRGYRVGARAMALGYAYLAQHDIGEIAQPVLREIADSYPVAASLVTREDLNMIYIAQARNRSARLMINVAIGSRISLSMSAGGRAYLAGCSAAARAGLLQRISAAVEPSAWPTIERGIKAAEKEYIEFGFCTAFNVNGSGINAVSTPFRHNGTLYSLTCAGPAVLVTVDQLMTVAGPAIVEQKTALERGFAGG